MNITVTPVTDLAAADDSATTAEDTPVSGTVATNDSTTSGGALTFAKASDPSHGTVVVNADGTYTYTPAANYNGPDSFTYTVTDPASGESLTQTVNITVTPVNDAPVGVGTIGNQADIDAETIAGLDVSGFFADVDGDTLSYSASGLPAGLTIDPITGIIGGTVDRSASQGGAGGVYTVTVTANDGNGGTAAQTFTWAVTNPAPTAGDNASTTLEDTPVSGNVLTNDSDPDGDTLQVTAFTIGGTAYAAGDSAVIAGVGTFTLSTPGVYTFTPAPNWNGTVPTVTYTVSDGEGGTDTADLVITVTPVNDAPTIAGGGQSGAVVEAGNLDSGAAVPGTPSASGNFTASDVENDALTWSVVGTPNTAYGTFSINPTTGAWTYALNNGLPATQALNEGDIVPLTYTVQVSDGRGGTDTRQVAITITGTNDSPVAVVDSRNVTESGVLNGGNTPTAGTASATGNVLTNDTDVDDGEKATLQVAAVSFGGSGGTLGSALAGNYGSLVLGTNGTFTYTLDNTLAATQALRQGVTATETFSYTVVDVNGATSTSTLTIRVAGTNDQPIITSVPSAALGAVTEQGTDNPGVPNTAGGTLTASDVDTGATQAWSITGSANGAYGTIAIDPTTGAWTYILDNTRAATQALNDDDVRQETFTARVRDEFGAYSDQVIIVTVSGSNDDLVGTGSATVTLTEDGSVSGTLQDYVSDVDDVLKLTSFQVDADGNGTSESYTPGDTVTLRDADGNTLGTLTIEEDGSYDFTPASNYAGNVPTVTYTIAESGGGSASITQALNFAITKVADAPSLEANKTVSTNEDVAVSLGLKAPGITDTGTGTGNNDYPERIGEITLTIGGTGATGVTLSTGATTLTPVGGKITVVLTDIDHISGVPSEDPANGVYYLTKAEFEALVANPSPERGNNFTVTVGATSYEVDAAGVIRPGVNGATSTQAITVDVQAVTDGATLTLNASDADLTFAEDGAINLSSFLAAARNNTDGNATTDQDGSERYSYTVSGVPQGTIVTINGTNYTAGASGSVTSAQSASLSATPAISIKPPADFSGDINGIKITLNTRDTDGDSAGTPATLTSEVTLNLHVTPVAGDVTASNVTTVEDNAVAFLAGVTVTDAGTGSEAIDSVAFTVPTGWTVTQPTASAGWSYNLSGSAATITFDNSLTEAQREAILDGFTIKPPAHSSADTTIALSITTTDSNTVNGATVSDTRTVSRDVKVTVTPIAEQVGQDSDGDSIFDVSMVGDHVYSVAGQEDNWFALGTNYTNATNIGGGYDLQTPWSNADPDEFTYAVLSPTLQSDTPGDSVIGTQFRYSTDGGVTWQTQTYIGEAIWVPQQYLNTLQVKLPLDVAGTLTIGVQAGTVDYDDDADVTVLPLDPPHISAPGVSVAISGEATLTMVRFDPLADAVTMALNSRVVGLEDAAIPLAIKTTSSDASETFNVTISGIPAGATIVYGGTPLTIVGGSVTIANFSNSTPMTIAPPPNSNENFQLTVSAVSVDGTSTSAPVSRTIDVSVTGVADTAMVTLPATSYSATESALDSVGGHKVALSDVVTSVTSPDNDGSETVTLRITGLAEGFSLTGATTVVSGVGAERVWMVPADKLADVSIVLPSNYSGTVNLKVAGVTTEVDGDSRTATLTDVSFTVTPSPEGTITTSATLAEDQITPLNLAIVHQNGDTDEVLGKAYVRVDYASGADYTLHLSGTELSAAGLATTTIGGASYFVIPTADVANLGAMGAPNLAGDLGALRFLYEVTDPSSDGSLSAVTEIKAGSLALTATPVTDAVDASITDIAMVTATGTAVDAVPGDDAVPDTATVTQSGSVTVNLHVASDDSDGSEHLVRVLIEGVPDGVTVTGASQVGAGSWLLVYEGVSAKSIGTGGIDVPVEFVVGKGAGNGASDIRMTVLAQDEGQSATTPASIQTDSVNWHLVLNLADGEPYAPPVIDEWRYNGAVGTEDTGFTLGSVIDAVVSTPDATTAYSYTVTITDLPTGSTVNGMILTTINGVPTWTATVTVSAGGNSQTALDSLLAGITIMPPANGNDNNADFRFDARLTAAAVGGTSVEADTSADMLITPMTDQAAITVVTSDIGEGATAITATITAEDTIDGAFGRIVDGKLYVQVSTHGNDGGAVTDGAGNTLVLSSISGVAGVPDGDYYVIDVGTAGGSVELTYTLPGGAVLQPGDVTFTAWAQTQETGASNIEAASGAGTADVIIINNGVAVQSQATGGLEPLSADKSHAIALAGLAVALNDNDGSETIKTILLSGLPVGFLLYVGNNAGDATLAAQASNAGGDGSTNTWVLSADGSLPAYVAILPPSHWSGELSNLALVVESGEASLPTTTVDTVPLGTVTVTPVANGLTIDPTLSFGRAGAIIDLNLNASMADPVAALATIADGSTETTTLQIKGLGEYAAFYMGDALIEGVSYDEAADTYTITGLSQDALETLGFVQAASALTDQDSGTAGTQVTVTAWTVESANGAESAHVSDTMTLAVAPVLATTGNDSLIWDGHAINGRAGTDTVALRYGEDVSHGNLAGLLKNIEVVDLSATGANSITGGLSIADVLNITGSNSGKLTINGDGDDSVVLSSASEWSTNGVVTDHHVTYTSSAGVTLLIDEDIYNNNHVSYAA